MIGTAISAALALGSAIYGGIQSRNAANNAQAILDEQKRDNQNWYDRTYNEDATQRADAQRILTMTQEALRDRNRAARGRAAVMGATDESVASEKAASSQALADAAAQIASTASQRKDAIQQQYMTTKQALAGQQVGVENEHGKNIATATAGVAEAAGTMGPAIDETEWAKNADSKIAGLFNKKKGGGNVTA